MTDFGICFLTLVPVRSSDSDTAEIVTQLLFGNALELIERSEKKNWVKIRVYEDGYEGWVDPKQVHWVSEEEYVQYVQLPYAFTFGNNNWATVAGEEYQLVHGSEIRLNSADGLELGDLKVEFSGSLRRPGEVELPQLLQSFRNAPYLWGGKSPFGIDCSGYVQQVCRMLDAILPRDASQQVQVGVPVEFGQHQYGDMAFFANQNGKIIHVGFCVEDGQIIHAHGKVRVDQLDEKGIYNRELKYYSHELHSIKRLIFE